MMPHFKGIFKNICVMGSTTSSIRARAQHLFEPKNTQLSGCDKLLSAFNVSRSFVNKSSRDEFDVVVIGGGPGGYVNAIKAAQLGLKTACVEKRGALGGTCLNIGCIPSKALLNVCNNYDVAAQEFEHMGIKVSGLSIDVNKLQRFKKKSVDALTRGVEFLFRKNQVSYLKGEGRLQSPTEISVRGLDGSNTILKAKNIVLATGSETSPMPGGIVDIDEKIILSSTGALDLQSVPKSMAVIGAGVIGIELGTAWRQLGCEVTVIEFNERFLPPVDSEISNTYMKILERELKFKMSTKVVGIDVKENSAVVHTESAKGGNPQSMEVEKVLVAVGRRPYSAGLGLEELGIQKDKVGRVEVDDKFRVGNYPNIRAIGDLIRGPMLAHKAEEEGIACAELIANVGDGHVNYQTIPAVIYTHPELASVGKSEDELKKEGINYKKGVFPFAANGRSRTADKTDGMVKVLTDKKTDKILGAWILGPAAGELISELVLAMEYGAASEDIARTCHSHPTLSEAVKEACMAAYDKAIHI